MQRLRIAPRPDWRARVEARGLDWHTAPDGSPYWDESVYWRFDSAEIDRIEAATEQLWGLCLAAIDHVIRSGRLGEFGYAPQIEALIASSWAERDTEPTIYARFDLAYDGTDLKLLELNGDTPTSLVEAAVIQWWWLQDVFPEADQFNSIHEKLIDAFRLYAQGAARGAFAPGLHFSCVTPHAEDEGTIAYLGVCAAEAGLATGFIPLDQIGWREGEGNPGLFVDQDDRAIDTLFKLVPWEWLLADPFGEHLAAEALAGRIRVIEPAWKMLASHKRLLMVLAQLNPGHPLILEASDRAADARGWGEFVKKPVHGREGQNVALMRAAMFGSQVIAGTGGHYGGDPVIYQRRARLAKPTAPTRCWAAGWSTARPAAWGCARRPARSPAIRRGSCPTCSSSGTSANGTGGFDEDFCPRTSRTTRTIAPSHSGEAHLGGDLGAARRDCRS